VNLEIRRKRSDGRKRLTRLEFAADKCLRRRKNDLIEDGNGIHQTGGFSVSKFTARVSHFSVISPIQTSLK
jgi:hypothetical protein